MFFLSSIFSTYHKRVLQFFNVIFLLMCSVLALMFSSMKLPSCSSVPSADWDAVFKAELGMHSENVVWLIFAKNILFKYTLFSMCFLKDFSLICGLFVGFFLSAKFLSWTRSYVGVLNQQANLVCKDSTLGNCSHKYTGQDAVLRAGTAALTKPLLLYT